MKRYIVSILACTALFSCGKKETETSTEKLPATAASNVVELTTEQAKNAGIETGKPQEKELSGTIQLQGSVTVPPQSIVHVTFPLGGYIRKTNLMPGMQVQKGQVLAVIEDMQYIQLQQDYLTAKEQFRLSEMEYNRQKELNAKKASSDKLFEQVTAEKETHRITMASLSQKLTLLGVNPSRLTASTISKSLSIVSPVNGLVSKVNVNVGKYIAATEMLFELINVQDIVLTFNAFEKDIPYLKTGQKVEVYLNDRISDKLSAKVMYINQSLNGDRAAEIICKLDRYDSALLPGQFVNADVSISNKKSLTVPEGAVTEWQGKNYVFEHKKENSYEMIPVTVGIVQNGMKQISSEKVSTNSELVIKNAYSLLMKAMNSGEEE
ncbi:efflux RND transporter periplasmic adaptor subunit [Flavobacterium sp. AG291]|uniref:efflux RND transporter periplasmic adaptor subunit n=1 Tax=Flavobacterium sp. AG291 TaxID=2184000 RepID=UPI000E0C949C|nr:efflux RND transporter periplasmic adaptor subunit [Flavobacterium sp. AG291]RDI04475.1 cobalt-zinc-cadmium efflux system membrane fusion protein [Flavobacterium sp. AG291]